jgi:hypothetical protein
MRLRRPGDLNTKDVSAEDLVAFVQAHDLLGVLNNTAKVQAIESAGVCASPDLRLLLLTPLRTRTDADINASRWFPSEDELGCEPSAEIVFGGKRHARDGFEGRTFAGRLVAANDDLRQVDKSAEALRSQSVNDIEKVAVALGLQRVCISVDSCFRSSMVSLWSAVGHGHLGKGLQDFLCVGAWKICREKKRN